MECRKASFGITLDAGTPFLFTDVTYLTDAHDLAPKSPDRKIKTAYKLPTGFRYRLYPFYWLHIHRITDTDFWNPNGT